MQTVEDFVKSFLDEHDVDRQELMKDPVVVATQELAEEGASSFLQLGGKPNEKEEVYGMILDGLRCSEVNRLKEESKNMYLENRVLRGQVTQLYAHVKTQRKVILERKIEDCLLKYENEMKNGPGIPLKKKLMTYDNIKWVQEQITKL